MIADDAGLHPHGVLKAGDRVLPARLRVGDQRLIRTGCDEAGA